jgi:TatA/E family protein of Tat protein translocase
MLGIGMSELIIILGVALLVFGPTKLPEVAKTIAKGLKELRKASDDLKSSVSFDLDDERPRWRPPPRPAEAALAAHDPADAGDAMHGPVAPDGVNLDDPGAAIAGSALAGSAPWPRPAADSVAQGAAFDDGSAGGAPAGSSDVDGSAATSSAAPAADQNRPER